MGKWIGLFLVISGICSLLFNELTVRIRRVWPWRRDDADPVHDAQLNQHYRYSVFAGSVASIELGAWLAELPLPHWALRLVVYAVLLAVLVWRQSRLASTT